MIKRFQERKKKEKISCWLVLFIWC